ncbi:hypothetical protein IPM65_03720 [Candidatus Roizmanbacteria bacterium]|nr:MAG: hypothetical protein IPM65_03720 [Candidatus Roizmanbacteria bacterium]
MKAEILHVLSYYELFEYPPTIEEIYYSLKIKTSFDEIESALVQLINRGQVFTKGQRYAKKREIIVLFQSKMRYSKKLTADFTKIHKVFTSFPTIQLVGISGSLSMLDADQSDDIDLFVVTAKDTLWLTRLYVLIVTRFLSLLGNYIAQKLCWNIFMEEECLTLPPKKQNEYTAHELIQLKIVYEKHLTSQKLQSHNAWILKILPNVQINYHQNKSDYRASGKSKILKYFDEFLRYFQLKWLHIKGYKTIEYDSQAWFIQDDFEQKIPRGLIRKNT